MPLQRTRTSQSLWQASDGVLAPAGSWFRVLRPPQVQRSFFFDSARWSIPSIASIASVSSPSTTSSKFISEDQDRASCAEGDESCHDHLPCPAIQSAAKGTPAQADSDVTDCIEQVPPIAGEVVGWMIAETLHNSFCTLRGLWGSGNLNKEKLVAATMPRGSSTAYNGEKSRVQGRFPGRITPEMSQPSCPEWKGYVLVPQWGPDLPCWTPVVPRMF
jgi:hypothetical protein